MRRVQAVTLLFVLLVCGCEPAPPSIAPKQTMVLERIPSPELQLAAHLVAPTRGKAVLEIRLSNVGQRTLFVDTGDEGYPMAHFAFSLQLPDHRWLSVDCSCGPHSLFGQISPYTVRLKPGQFWVFKLSLSALSPYDPAIGDCMDIHRLNGRILIELQVPTPPEASRAWPGYVAASVPLP